MNSIKISSKVALLIAISGFLFSTMSQTVADSRLPKTAYRAEAIVTSDGVNTPMVMYSKGKKMRIEMNTGSKKAVQIIDLDTDEAFMLTHANGQKIAAKISTKNTVMKMGLEDIDLGRSTGKKEIAQTTCKIYKIKEGTVCLTRYDIVLESIGRDGTMLVTKLKTGRQKDSLFEIPADYKIIDLGSMSGMDTESFSNKDNILKGIMENAGLEDSSGTLLEGIDGIVEAGGDDAAGQAAMDALMGQMGFDPGTLTTGDTTAGVLSGALKSSTSNADKQKQMRLMQENERQMKLIEQGGMAAMLRDAGMSEEQIQQMEETQAKMAKQLKAHGDKHKKQINSIDTSKKPSDAKLLNLENLQTDLDAMNDRAKALVDGGNISETDKAQLQKDAEEKLKSILGGLPKQ